MTGAAETSASPSSATDALSDIDAAKSLLLAVVVVGAASLSELVAQQVERLQRLALLLVQFGLRLVHGRRRRPARSVAPCQTCSAASGTCSPSRRSGARAANWSTLRWLSCARSSCSSICCAAVACSWPRTRSMCCASAPRRRLGVGGGWRIAVGGTCAIRLAICLASAGSSTSVQKRAAQAAGARSSTCVVCARCSWRAVSSVVRTSPTAASSVCCARTRRRTRAIHQLVDGVTRLHRCRRRQR
jgi:hypothetical protein